MFARLTPMKYETLLSLSHGEVYSIDTINFGSSLPIRGGIFCQQIFGPVKSFECECGRYNSNQYAGAKCDRCKVMCIPSDSRAERMGHISLPFPVPNPILIDQIARILQLPKTLLKDTMLGENSFQVFEDKEGSFFLKNGLRVALVPTKAAKVGNESLLNVTSGIALSSLIEHIDQEKSLTINPSEDFKRLIECGFTIDDLFMKAILVLPPYFRPIVNLGGSYSFHPINTLYIRVLIRSNRIKELTGFPTPDLIVENESHNLFKAINRLFVEGGTDSNRVEIPSIFKHGLSGKQGIIRSSLFGKRVDFSGRSAITSGPDLDVDEIGIPRSIAYELFKPFIISDMMKNHTECWKYSKALKYYKSKHEFAISSMEKVVKKRRVIINRAPTLHRFGVMAFRVKLISDKCIRMPPMACAPFNADFDGDCLSGNVKIPLLSGQEMTIPEMVEKYGVGAKIWVYSYDESTGEIVPSEATILGRSGVKDRWVEITVDNGEKVRCSPEHPWMMKDGSFKKASELISGDSMMPFYRTVADSGFNEGKELIFHPNSRSRTSSNIEGLGRLVIGRIISRNQEVSRGSYELTRKEILDSGRSKATPKHETLVSLVGEDLIQWYHETTGYWELTHHMVAKNILGFNEDAGVVVHHDSMLSSGFFDPRNNDPSCLRLMSAREHNAYHNLFPEFTAKKTAASMLFNNEGRGLERRISMKRSAESAKIKSKREFLEENLPSDRSYWEKELAFESIGEYWRRLFNDGTGAVTLNQLIWFVTDKVGISLEELQEIRNKNRLKSGIGRQYRSNHKVVRVEFLDYSDVSFDLEVPKYHNFATSSGLITHNTVAVHVPLDNRSVSECNRILSPSQNILGSLDGKPIVAPSHEAVIGLHYMTNVEHYPDPIVENSFDRLLRLHETITPSGRRKLGISDEVRFRENGKERITCVGRLLLERVMGTTDLPAEFNKSSIKKMIEDAFIRLSRKDLMDALSELSRLAFKYATESGISICIEDIVQPPSKAEIVAAAKEEVSVIRADKHSLPEDKFELSMRVWFKAINSLNEEFLTKTDPDNPLLVMYKTGSRVSLQQVSQLVSAKGMIADISNKIKDDPVFESFRDGINPFDYFQSCSGSRKSLGDKKFVTPVAGYTARKLVTACRDLYITQFDCESTGTVTLAGDQSVGRFGKDGELITEPSDGLVEVRSPIHCKCENGVCIKCYGVDPSTKLTPRMKLGVGVIAAHSLTEVLTQMGLRTFHTGGAASLATSDKVVKTDIGGVVSITDENDDLYRISVGNRWYLVAKSAKLLVSTGSEVTAGTILASFITNNLSNQDITGTIPRLIALYDLTSFDKEPEAVLSSKAGIVELRAVGREKIAIYVDGSIEGTMNGNVPLLVGNGSHVTPGQKLSFGFPSIKTFFYRAGFSPAFIAFKNELLATYGRESIKPLSIHIEMVYRAMTDLVVRKDGSLGTRVGGDVGVSQINGCRDIGINHPSFLKSMGFGWSMSGLKRAVSNMEWSYDLPSERIMTGEVLVPNSKLKGY